MSKRSARVHFSDEIRVLKKLRHTAKLSMRAAAEKLGLSDSYISHIENGRMDLPKDKRLEELLAIYNSSPSDFNKLVQRYKKNPEPKDELRQLLKLASSRQLETLLPIVKAILAART